MLRFSGKNIYRRLLTLILALQLFSSIFPYALAQDDINVTAIVPPPVSVEAPVVNAIPICTAGTSRSISLTVVGGSANREYFFEVSSSNTFVPLEQTFGWSTATSDTFSGLTLNTTYFYRAKARDSTTLEESPYSNIVSSAQQGSCGGFVAGGGGGGGAGSSPTPTNTNSSNANASQQNTNQNSANTNRNAFNNNTNAGNNNKNLNLNSQNQNTNGREIIVVSVGTAPSRFTTTPSVELVAAAAGATTICYWGDTPLATSRDNRICLPYGQSYPLQLTGGDGLKNILVQLSNDSFTSEVFTVPVILDTIPPPAPQAILPATTDIRLLDLLLGNLGDAQSVYISGDVVNTDATFEWLSAGTSFPLILAGEPGVKHISIQTRDAAGNLSVPVTYEVLFNEAPQNENQNQPVNHNVNSPQKNNNSIVNTNTNSPINRNSNFSVNTNTNTAPIVNTNQNVVVINTNQNTTVPRDDADNDNLNASDEQDYYHTDPTKSDTDGDGLSDGQEINTDHTDPLTRDTDGDFLNDGDEINQYHTDPLKSDTDSDGFSDAAEITAGTDPRDPNSHPPLSEIDPLKASLTDQMLCQRDTDQDGLSDCIEKKLGTDPNKKDTDGDGYSDGDEVLQYGTNPLDKNDNPDTNSQLKIVNWEKPNPTPQVMSGSDWLVKGICTFPGNVKVFLKSTTSQEIDLGDTACLEQKNFLLESSKNLDDGYYSLIARRYDQNGKLIEESRSVSIIVDKSRAIRSPKPVAIEETPVDPQLKVIVEVHNNIPTVYCLTVPGAKVEATFKSIITSSAIIADASTGNCAIRASEALEKGDHHVILYAVTPEGIRSSTVNVPFLITDAVVAGPTIFSWWWLLLLLLISSALTYWYYRKEKKNGKQKVAAGKEATAG